MAGRDDYAIVLDFLPEGHPLDKRPSHKKNPVAQAIGKTRFSLLELVPKPGVYLNIGDEVYIGEGKREKIHHIEGRVTLDKLTNTAQGELQIMVEKRSRSVTAAMALIADHGSGKGVSPVNSGRPPSA